MSIENNSTSARKLDEALRLLNEAAREKKDEIQGLLSEKYGDIKDVLGQGGARAKEWTEDVEEKVRQNPWPYIGGVALGALFVGFLMGTSRQK